MSDDPRLPPGWWLPFLLGISAVFWGITLFHYILKWSV